MFTPYVLSMNQWDASRMSHWHIDYSPARMRAVRKHLYALTDNPILINTNITDQCDGILSNLDGLSDDEVRNSGFYIYYSRGERALPALRRIVDCGGLFAPPPYMNKVPYAEISGNAIESFNEAGMRLGREPFGGLEVASQLCQAVEMTQNLPGDFVEIGVFTGSSALVTQLHMRNRGVLRRCWLLDTYSGFDYDTARESADIIWSNTHAFIAQGAPLTPQGSIELLSRLMEGIGHDVRFVQNNICVDEIPDEIESIALANIDVDLYEAVLRALNKVAPKMVHRGVIVVEDPVSLPGLYGAYLALDEFMKSDLGKMFSCVKTTSQYLLIKVQP